MSRRSTPVDAPRYLQVMANAIQPKLPLSVDAGIALEAVEAFEDTMYYSYRAIGKVRTDFDTASFANTVKLATLPGFCEKAILTAPEHCFDQIPFLRAPTEGVRVTCHVTYE